MMDAGVQTKWDTAENKVNDCELAILKNKLKKSDEQKEEALKQLEEAKKRICSWRVFLRSNSHEVNTRMSI